MQESTGNENRLLAALGHAVAWFVIFIGFSIITVIPFLGWALLYKYKAHQGGTFSIPIVSQFTARYAGTAAILILALLSAPGSPSTFGAPAKGQTARAALEQVRQFARKWQADATLYSVSSLAVREDGTVSGTSLEDTWYYEFYSPKSPLAKQVYTVHLADGKPEGIEKGGGGVYKPITRDFVDTDRVADELKKNGIALKGRFNMTLTDTCAGVPRKCGLIWQGMLAGEGGKATLFYVDALTGKLFSKLSY